MYKLSEALLAAHQVGKLECMANTSDLPFAGKEETILVQGSI
jgi:hypothetical protein